MPTQPSGQPGQPPNPNAPPAPGTSTVRGHVFAADSGQPLRKAQVRMTSGELRENRLATTDVDGRYEFKEVRAGRYTISANKGSYVGLSYGQQRPNDAPKPIAILDNQLVERMDFTLPRGGVITGRILDEFGEPMADVQVAAQQYQTVQGQRRLVPTGRQGSTNDIGEFRLFGISPGQYYLMATWRSTNPMNNQEKIAYAPMYYPGTDNAAQAQRVTLAAGQELSDIVMSLKPMRATRVSGTVVSSDGRPMPGYDHGDVHRRVRLLRIIGRADPSGRHLHRQRPRPRRVHAARAVERHAVRRQRGRDRQDHRDRRRHHGYSDRRGEAVDAERADRDRSGDRGGTARHAAADADADGARHDADGFHASAGWPATAPSS